MENNNKKSGITLYLIIITIITAVCIIVGVFGRTFHVKGKNRFGNVFTKAGAEVTEEMKTEAFDTVNIDLDMGEIVFEEGDDYFVSYAFPEKIVPIMKVNNGALTITQTDGKVLNLEDFSDCKFQLIWEISMSIKFPHSLQQFPPIWESWTFRNVILSLCQQILTWETLKWKILPLPLQIWNLAWVR